MAPVIRNVSWPLLHERKLLFLIKQQQQQLTEMRNIWRSASAECGKNKKKKHGMKPKSIFNLLKRTAWCVTFNFLPQTSRSGFPSWLRLHLLSTQFCSCWEIWTISAAVRCAYVRADDVISQFRSYTSGGGWQQLRASNERTPRMHTSATSRTRLCS